MWRTWFFWRHRARQRSLLNRPFGVEVDADGLVYISDTYNSVIRVVEPE